MRGVDSFCTHWEVSAGGGGGAPVQRGISEQGEGGSRTVSDLSEGALVHYPKGIPVYLNRCNYKMYNI
jgi:hypothetical protein